MKVQDTLDSRSGQSSVHASQDRGTRQGVVEGGAQTLNGERYIPEGRRLKLTKEDGSTDTGFRDRIARNLCCYGD